MLSIFPLRTSDPARYYIEAVSLGAEEYYLSRGEVPGRWLGRCSEALGLSGTVDADDLRSLLAGTRPDGGDLRDGWVLRPGYDATFSAPKSVSVLYALGDRDDVRAVVAAHDAAVAGAIGYLERHACRVRRGGIHGRGVRFEAGGGMVGAAFVHHTSRAGDPQLHTHVLIVNATPGPDGRWTGIDSAGLFAHAKAAAAVYQAILRRGLVDRLGLRFELSGDGTGDIVGVPAEVRARFSKRRAAIEEHMRKQGTSGPRAAEVATLATRQAKDHSVSELDLRIGWRQEAEQLGFEATSVPRSPRRLFAALPNDEALASRITLDDATFDAAKAVWAVAALATDGAELAEIEERAQAFLASPLVVEVAARRWTTTEMLALEERVVAFALGGRAGGYGAADRSSVDDALRARPSLSDEQVAMVRRIATSGDQIDVVVGAPGSGKTFALDAARAAWQASGSRVLGCALAARAARGLQAGSGITSRTIDRLLFDLDAGNESLDRKTIVLVDEAAMVGTRKLARLVDACARADAKLVLVGDPKQLPAIEAGGMFEALASRLGETQLTGNRRQQHPGERAVVADLRDGHVQRAIERLRRLDGMAVFANADTLADAMVEDWSAATKAGADVLMLAPTRDTTAGLNARARQRMEAEGMLGPVVAQVGHIEFAVGDRVVCTRNNKRLGVVNGDTGTVVGACMTGLVVTLDGAEVELSEEYLAAGNLSHGYALTMTNATQTVFA
jgi:conjugative relaxase-like TrwC/TraI family protein